MKLFALAIVFVLITGCAASISAQKESFGPGTILVLPARNVVQGGRPHPVGAQSGNRLTGVVISGIDRSSSFKAISTRSKDFNNRTIADVDDAVREAKNLDVDYVLIIVLGEFLDAAPMTFRPDYVTLDSARLYSVPSGDIVWQTTKTFQLASSNFGNYYDLVDGIGENIVKSITE